MRKKKNMVRMKCVWFLICLYMQVFFLILYTVYIVDHIGSVLHVQ